MISQNKEYNSDSKSRVLAEIAIFVALATALSLIIIFQLPEGGSITLASMVPIIWLALRRGPKIGLTACFGSAGRNATNILFTPSAAGLSTCFW
jgi:thiamine transporter